jgi:hypothetical protein
MVDLQRVRFCLAILLCQDSEATLRPRRHSFSACAPAVTRDPQSRRGSAVVTGTSASEDASGADDHLRGGLADFRGGSFAGARHRLGTHDHHDPSRQGQQGPSCNVVPAFTRGAATVLAAEETCGMALSRQKPRPTGRLHRLAKGLSQCCPQSWSDQEGFAAFAAPQLRYPSAGIRYGSSHHPVAVGPQQLEAHDSLPTRFSKTRAGYGQSPGFLALDQRASKR